jgi:F-type H+-transporting ATPase subunit epsilon
MTKISCKFVRPDRLVYEGDVDSLILQTASGELGVWPNHAPLICALGDGEVRLHLGAETGDSVLRVLVMGGYAEVKDNNVIILADNALREDEVDGGAVKAAREKAVAERDKFAEGDNRRVYYENMIRWCDLQLRYAK